MWWLTNAFADRVLIDEEREDAALQEKASVERRLVKRGERALRWEPDEAGQSIRLTGVPRDLSRFRSFSMWLHSAKMTGARFRIELLSPDAEDGYACTFAVDWRGWNRMELPTWAFEPFGQPKGMSDIRALRFRVQSTNWPGTVLVIDDVGLSTENMKMPAGDDFVVVDCQWRSPFQRLDLWKPRAAHGTAVFTRKYWCWVELGYRERAGKRDVLSFVRELDVDIGGWDEVSVRICQDRQGYLNGHATIDGKRVPLTGGGKGTGKFVDLSAPVTGRRLQEVVVDMSEPADEIGGTGGRNVVAFLQYVGLSRGSKLHTKTTPAFPKPRPKAEQLETAGIPFGLYFSRDEVPDLRRRAGCGLGKAVFESIKRSADAGVSRRYDARPPRFLGGGWFGYIRPVKPLNVARVVPCAFAYVLTGDEAYAQAARRALLAICRVEHWTNGEMCRYPLGWGGFGNPFTEAHYAVTVATAYDWIYNVLSQDERDFIERSLREKALYWLDDNVRYRFPAHMNQGAVFGAGYTLAVLALHRSDPALEPLVQRAREAMSKVCRSYWGEDGWAPEGFGYWQYTLSTAITGLVPLARASKQNIEQSLPAGLRKGMLYPLHLRSLASSEFGALNFSDCHYGGRPRSDVLLFYASVLGDGRARQLWEEVYGGDNPPGDFLTFLWCEPSVPATPPRLEPAFRFSDRSTTFLRSGTAFGDTLFALQTSAMRQGHDHRDRNSFILEAFGERLAIDPGQIDYADPAHQELKKAFLHSTLTVDGRDQDLARRPYVTVERLCTSPGLFPRWREARRGLPRRRAVR